MRDVGSRSELGSTQSRGAKFWLKTWDNCKTFVKKIHNDKPRPMLFFDKTSKGVLRVRDTGSLPR